MIILRLFNTDNSYEDSLFEMHHRDSEWDHSAAVREDMESQMTEEELVKELGECMVEVEEKLECDIAEAEQVYLAGVIRENSWWLSNSGDDFNAAGMCALRYLK